MSIIISINDRYRIELDNCLWLVAKRQIDLDDSTKYRWAADSNHKTLQQAGERLLLRLISDSELEGVQEICDALNTASTLIAHAIVESGLSDSWLDMKDTITGHDDETCPEM